MDSDRGPDAVWLRQAVFYRTDLLQQVAPAGILDLTSLVEYLPALVQLGANVVWLRTTPDAEIGQGELIQAAHTRGLRVVLDFDCSDTSDVDHVIDAARVWVERGVDGFVLSKASTYSLEIWTRLRRELRSVRPDVAVIADSKAPPGLLVSSCDHIDGVLDHLFKERMHAFMTTENESAAEFWRRHEQSLQDGPTRITFLESPDKNPAPVDTERLKLSAMLQLTLPSAVVVSESEVGLMQSRAIVDRDVLEFYRSILFWRNKHGVSQLRPNLVHAGDDGTLIYRSGPWLILLNRSDDEIEIDLGSHGSLWLMLATSNSVRLHGSRLVLSRYSGAVLGNERARQSMR